MQSKRIRKEVDYSISLLQHELSGWLIAGLICLRPLALSAN